jgi:non-ribosomal peptide synthetase component E (peptide arylation enzyme)
MGDRCVKRTLASLLDEAAAHWGPCEALYHEGRRWNFAETVAGVDAAARGLIALGIAPGDKVVLWMPNRPE